MQTQTIIEPGDIKPGIKSTEFWGKLLVQLVLLANSVFGLGIEISDADAILTVGALEGLYQIWRGIMKSRAATPKKTEITNG